MKIDELKQRMAMLEQQIKEEDARLERGEGDRMRRAVLYEELLEVRADLRSLQPKRRIGYGSRSGNGEERSMNERAIADWKQAQQDEEQEDDPRAALFSALKNSKDVLTPRQYQVFLLKSQGCSGAEIARRLDVCPTTVSSTLRAARKRLNERADATAAVADKEPGVVDLADPNVIKAILPALTEKQAIYLYLYYAEWLSAREIAELLDLKSHSSVIRSIHLGLKNLGEVLGTGTMELQHAEALDALAYEIYKRLPPEQLLTEEARQTVERVRPRPAPPAPKQKRSGERPQFFVRSGCSVLSVRHGGAPRHGKLLTALLERWEHNAGMQDSRPQTLWSWLRAVFGVLCKNKRGAYTWRRKQSH